MRTKTQRQRQDNQLTSSLPGRAATGLSPRMRGVCLWIIPAVALILLGLTGGAGAPMQADGTNGGVTTGARWTGTISIDEPEHRALGTYSSRQARFTVTMVEKVSPGGGISLELEHLDWSQERKVRSAVELSLIHI